MKFTYISPSELPSRAANSVHVIMQCAALSQVSGVDLTLYAKRKVLEHENLIPAIQKTYGVDLSNVRVVSFAKGRRGANIRIAILALWDLFRRPWPDVILSRNLYASYIIGVILRRPILFETHQLERGIRKSVQKAIMLRSNVITVVISNKLEEYLTQHHLASPVHTLVLHDAAPAGIQFLKKEFRNATLKKVYPQAEGDWEGVCGYFGHLYAGRGVEIIESIAKARPNILFLLFGGNEENLRERRKNNTCSNLHYVGHVPHPVAQQAMKSVDILLMPYQKSVAIGVSGHDTARWMSPMKMFEYMATGVPIISSDLPVLREVLTDGKNALLVPPDNPDLWISAVDRLMDEKGLSSAIGLCAHKDYKAKYTWHQRALSLIDAAKGF